METMIKADELLAQQYDVLGHDGIGYTEIRDILNSRSYFVETKEEFIKVLEPLINRDIYCGLQPRNTNRGRACDISNITVLCVDIDPIRPKGEASTEEQHKSALDLGRRITESLKGTFAVSSGSGCHVYFPIRTIPVVSVPELTKSLAAWMDSIRSNYATEGLKIDSIHDLPRVIRIWGSFNTKSKRVCAPITEIPSGRLDYAFEQTPKVEEKSQLVLTDLEDRFERLRRNNSTLSNIADGTHANTDRSATDYVFIRILAEAGFTEEQIIQLKDKCVSGKLGLEDRSSDIRRVYKKVLEDRTQGMSGDVLNLPTQRNLGIDSKSYLSALRERRIGLLSGIEPLDRMVSGFRNQKLYIFAARPNEGKTTLATQILVNIAEQGKTCLFFPTEVGAEPIYDKIVSNKTGINLKKFQNGTFSPEEFKLIDETVPKVKHLPIMIVEDFGLTVQKVEEGIKKYAPQVVCVDFFQALKWNDPESVGEKSGTVRKFKEMAGDYDIPFILMSQLNRNDGESNLKNLKGTGTLEELGDVITFIKTVDKLAPPPTPVDLVVMKSKYSATGLIKTVFYRNQCRFEALENQEEN